MTHDDHGPREQPQKEGQPEALDAAEGAHRISDSGLGGQTRSAASPEHETVGYSPNTPSTAPHVAADMASRIRPTDPDRDVAEPQPGVSASTPQAVGPLATGGGGSREFHMPDGNPGLNPMARRVTEEGVSRPRALDEQREAALPQTTISGAVRPVVAAEEERLDANPVEQSTATLPGEWPSSPSIVSGGSDPTHS